MKKDILADNNEEDDGFKVETKKEADWAMRKIRQLSREKEENKEMAEEQIAEIESWLDSENNKLEDNIEFFKSLLFEFLYQQRKEKDEEIKTINLPSGSVKARKQRNKWNYDSKKLVDGVKEAGLDDVVEVKEKVNKRELKDKSKVLDNGVVINEETGEIIEGVRVEERGEKFSVKVKE